MTFRSILLLNLVLVCIITARNVSADNHDSVEADFFDDAPLILTASRMSKPIAESPASVSVIDRKMIESSGAREIADLFRLVPGFIVGQFSGDKPVVTYLGMGNEFPRKMQVLVDGRSVLIPSFGGVPWTNLPLLLEDIERIEIIRGPNAVTYGANAFLATINIITRHAAEDFGTRYTLTSSDNSNPDIKDAYVRVGVHQGDLDWRLSVGALNDDGFNSVNDSVEIVKLNFRMDVLSGSNQFWTVQAGTSNSVSGKGFANKPEDVERDAEATNSYLNVLWENNSENSVSSIRLTHTEQDVINNFNTDPSSAFTAFIDFDRISRRTDLELIRSQDIGPKLRLAYGGSLRRDSVNSLFLLGDRNYHDIDTSRLFSALEWRPDENWLFDIGATIEDSDLTEIETSPRFSLIRKLNQQHALRFVASKAKRNPILFENRGLSIFTTDIDLDADGTPDLFDVDIQTWQGNPDIEPENIVSYEFGLRSQLVDKAISSDVKIFTYRISDHIVSVDTATPDLLGFVKTSANQGNTRVSGVEWSFDFSPTENLDVKSGLSIIRVDSTNSQFEVLFPENTAFINSNYRWRDQHQFSASFYFINEMQWQESNDLVPAIKKLDLRYVYQLDPGTETKLELIAQNVLDEFEDYFPENIQEKIFFLRLSGGF